MKKIISINTLAKTISKLKTNGKKVVLCHGVFDLLHIGHINHFKEAKNLGDVLVVTVTQDKYVNKGPNRPIFSLNTRMESIAALKDIDYVAPNIFSNAIQLIKILKPTKNHLRFPIFQSCKFDYLRNDNWQIKKK